MASASEKRTFRMHADMLYSVIKNQAGTISKAILELVMNSIDAGATQVDVTLDRKNVSVKDDGKGFTSQQEILEWFETFGTPHKEGDAVYGRFRMGRGQIMAFCQNQWRSGTFGMSVDIKNKGLDYLLEKDLEKSPGCLITGQMYEPLTPSDLLNTANTLREQCKYTPIPVMLNGERINEDVAKAKWTEITDEAYIRITQGSQLSIYNLGVLVCHEYSAHHGVGGVVVSKQALEVNFARNDVIKGQCAVWKKIKPVLARHANKEPRERREKRTDEWREYQARELMSWDGNRNEAAHLIQAPIFTDIVGKHWSLSKLDNDRCTISLAAPGNHKADVIHQQQRAIILDEEKMEEWFDPSGLEKALKRIAGVKAQAGVGEYDLQSVARRVLGRFVPFASLAADLKDEHFPLTEKDLSKAGVSVLRILNQQQSSFLWALREALGLEDLKARTIYAMRSDTAAAYTDGRTSIHLHRDYLSSLHKGPMNGLGWSAKMVALLTHEYLHAFNSGVGHSHDAEFYQLFERAMQHPGVLEHIRHIFNAYVGAMKRVPSRLALQMDRNALIEDQSAEDRLRFEQAVAAEVARLHPPQAVPVEAAVPKKPRLTWSQRLEEAGQQVLRFEDAAGTKKCRTQVRNTKPRSTTKALKDKHDRVKDEDQVAA